jgi:hypothetical protein
LVVATATPQTIPGICGCVNVADQYDVLGEIVGAPTPEVPEKFVSSANVA